MVFVDLLHVLVCKDYPGVRRSVLDLASDVISEDVLSNFELIYQIETSLVIQSLHPRVEGSFQNWVDKAQACKEALASHSVAFC